MYQSPEPFAQPASSAARPRGGALALRERPERRPLRATPVPAPNRAVYQTVGEEARAQRPSPLAQERLDPGVAQHAESVPQRRGAEHAHAAVLELCDARRRRIERRHDPRRHLARRAHELHAQVEHRAPVEHDAHRRPARRDHSAHRELRVVTERGRAADRDRVEPGAHPVYVLARRFTGDPLRAAGGVGNAAVDRRGELEGDERSLRLLPREQEGRVERRSRLREQADRDRHALGAQRGRAAPRLRVRVGQRRDDAGHTGGHDRVGARWCLAVVRARLEVHHQGGAARTRARGLEGDDLRMRSAVLGVVTLGHHPVSREHDGADQGIRSNAPPTPACEVEGAFHGRPLGGRSLRIRSECRYLRRHVPPWDRSPGTA